MSTRKNPERKNKELIQLLKYILQLSSVAVAAILLESLFSH